jgi:hypothetical protein
MQASWTGLERQGRALEARADALGQLARDYDAWGLAPDAAEVRHRARAHRVHALLLLAQAAALRSELADLDDQT